MIKSFADKETKKIFNQIFSRKLPQLDGDRKGQYSIRINGQYRICFKNIGNDYYDVEIVDYH